MPEVYIVSAARSAIGSFGGTLKDQKPGELAGLIAREAIARATLAPEQIENVVFGNVIPTEPRDAYMSRIAAVEAGIPLETPAMNVNRLCGSGVQAIISAAQSIMLGDYETGLAGGAEIMSRAPYFSPATRWGQKMGDAAMIDGLTGTLSDPFQRFHMGVTAENIAARYNITRDEQDALAALSHARAANAQAQGYFTDQIVPIEIKARGKVNLFTVDEHVRGETSVDSLATLKPVFLKENGTVTAGNASGINDAAAAVVLASGEAVKKHNLKPLARLVAYGHAGVDPAYMGIGPVPASRIALNKAGISVADLDVIESNEAFAAQACAVAKELDFDPAKVNPNGSGISLGHPVGATGAIITTKMLYELQRTGGRYGLTTMCIGGGQGIAVIWENVTR